MERLLEDTEPVAASPLESEALTPSWVTPLAPAGFGGPGVINPYSNVNPLNPMADEMHKIASSRAAPFRHYED